MFLIIPACSKRVWRVKRTLNTCWECEKKKIVKELLNEMRVERSRIWTGYRRQNLAIIKCNETNNEPRPDVNVIHIWFRL